MSLRPRTLGVLYKISTPLQIGLDKDKPAQWINILFGMARDDDTDINLSFEDKIHFFKTKANFTWFCKTQDIIGVLSIM